MSADIQFRSFGPGLGFVLHRVRLAGSAGRFSAWFDGECRLVEAEQYDRMERARPVARNGAAWRGLAAVGRRYLGVAS